MNVSARHHTLPKFYLKGFTSAQGTMAVYNKESRSIEKELQHLKARFFVWDRNSVMLNGELQDFPEQAYSRIDTQTGTVMG